MVDRDEAKRALDFAKGLLERPTTMLKSICDLDHRRSIQAVMTMQKNWLIRRFCDDRGGLVEKFGD
jgi:hypothetical protein